MLQAARVLIFLGAVTVAVAVLALGGYDDPAGRPIAGAGLLLELAGFACLAVTWWRSPPSKDPADH